ncbi:MAG: hypothetical protein ABJO67_12645 [Pseudoruegeria sp.]
MFEFLSKEVQEGLDQARKQALRKGNRLCVHSDGEVHRILKLWDDGFALERDVDLRGFVDIYDGPRHISQCLIIQAEMSHGEYTYEFKRSTPARNKAPVDFAIEEIEPAALITRA